MSNQKGFTIIELLIATTIVSVILLMVSVMMINVGNLLHKGITQSNVQENVRTVTDDIANQIKDSSGPVIQQITGNIGRYCVNGMSYTYILGVQMGTGAGESPHVLLRDQFTGLCTVPSAADFSSPPATAVELLYPNSRLFQFSIPPQPAISAKTYAINIGVAYGDNDLLCSPSFDSSKCTGGAPITLTDAIQSDLTCRNSSSRSFCATAKLSTQVTQRL